jgi:NDP-sugar pyrophosphorylase family protein
MKAILIVNRLYPAAPRRTAGRGRGLPPLVDRPFLQHVVEAIIEAGAEEIHVILSGDSTVVEETFGKGHQWGVALRYHRPAAGEGAYEAVSEIPLSDDNPIFLAHADTLPQLGLEPLARSTAPVFYCWKDGGRTRWTGWAVVRADDLKKRDAGFDGKGLLDRPEIVPIIAAHFHSSTIEEVPKPLSLTSYQDLIEAHLRVLRQQHTGLLLTGRKIAPGVNVARNVTIHRTARLTGPLFIGENSRIGEHCHVGPGASIGKDCLIESRTAIENSVVCPGSYVGEGLDLRQVYIDGGRLVNTRLFAEVERVDELLLGCVYGPRRVSRKKVASWIR